MRDLLGILESAYRESPEPAWRRDLTDAAAVLDDGHGVFFTRIVFSGGGASLRAMHHADHFGSVSPECVQLFHHTAQRVPVEHLRQILRGSGHTASAFLRGQGGIEVYQPMMARLGVFDCLSMHGLMDGCDLFGVLVPLARARRLDRRTTHRYRLLGAHLAAARRLREQTAREEAVLDPDGRLAHAEPAAVAARDALVRRVRAIESARTQRGRSDVDGALALWRGLVAGEWSLVERFESDGRRFLVARRNAPHLGAVFRLSPTEARVVRLTALGQSQKMIGYVLGLSVTVVSEALSNAMLKLRVRNRSELAAVAGPLVQAAEEAQSEQPESG